MESKHLLQNDRQGIGISGYGAKTIQSLFVKKGSVMLIHEAKRFLTQQ